MNLTETQEKALSEIETNIRTLEKIADGVRPYILRIEENLRSFRKGFPDKNTQELDIDYSMRRCKSQLKKTSRILKKETSEARKALLQVKSDLSRKKTWQGFSETTAASRQ